MTYSSSASTNFAGEEYTPLTEEELLLAQKQRLIKLWVGCYTLTHRLYGSGHTFLTELNTIKAQYLGGQITALQAQDSCFDINAQLTSQNNFLAGQGDWSILTKFKVDSRENILNSLGVYSYANDANAIAGGCGTGDVYYNTTTSKLRAVA